MALHLTENDLHTLPTRKRAHLINALSGPKSANLIGTSSQKKEENLAVFSSSVHLGADPPLMGFVSRPNSVPRHTLENIEDTHDFTLNHISSTFYQQAHLCSAHLPRDHSEFEYAQLTPYYLPSFSAPFVKESTIKIGLTWLRTVPITENNTHFIIGKIQHILLEDDDILLESGDLNIAKANSVAVTGLYTYHTLDTLGTLPYAQRPQAS